MDHQRVSRTMVRPAWLVAGGLAAIALIAVGVPLASLLYVGILLLCPLVMLGMHRGHGQRHGHGTHADGPGHGGSDRGSPPTNAPGSTREGGGT